MTVSLGALALILIGVVGLSFSGLAQISFKFGIAASRTVETAGAAAFLVSTLLTPGVIIALTLYGIGTLLWLSLLGRVPVSQVGPFVGLGFVLGNVIFGDHLGMFRGAGILVVIGGSVLVGQSS